MYYKLKLTINEINKKIDINKQSDYFKEDFFEFFFGINVNH